MTTVGISYLQYKEDVRKNLRNEQLKEADLQEQHRRNLAQELEVNRHNVASEALSQLSLDETVRSNLARERETNRANLAKEAETNRANLAKEQQNSYDTNIRYLDTVTQTRYAGEEIGLDSASATTSALARGAGALLNTVSGIVRTFSAK